MIVVRPTLTKVDRSGECWLWTGFVQTNGYASTTFDGKTQGVHRVAWQLAFGPIPDGMQVCHRCDVKLCVRPEHLFLGTSADNIADRDAKGRTAKGHRSGPAVRDYGTTCKRGHDRAENRRYQFSRRLGRWTPYCGKCKAEQRVERYHATKPDARYYRASA